MFRSTRLGSRQSRKLAGQGEPVPAYLGRGAWLIEKTIYLSLDYSPAEGQAIQDFPKAIPDGTLVMPISAQALARHFGITVFRLLAANATG